MSADRPPPESLSAVGSACVCVCVGVHGTVFTWCLSVHTFQQPPSPGDCLIVVPEVQQPSSARESVRVTSSYDDKRSEENGSDSGSPTPEKKSKGRTGWPQHVWAAELKQ
ncbi:hypothetical protein C0Q70_05435 [Pomacea canaliculata]|uniref:Uncharacterized protein n=1 Tax=Pomacea canaliculata TaxID=400727 RepID=A0A2T7PL99_POMCA|nr:hypothetical protein C0Q70_05435 [Pomacea canaliculata]